MKIPPIEIERLNTERLILIPFTIQICNNLLNGDFSDLYTMKLRKGKGWPDADVLETLPKIINNLNEAGSVTGFESWMIIKKDTFEVIGDTGFKGFNYETDRVDIGYGVIQEERRKGYAEEAATVLIQWAFANERVQEITARCLAVNHGSIHLLQKLHFTQKTYNNDMIHWSLRRADSKG